MCITSSQGDMNTREKSSWNLSITGILQIKASYNYIWPCLWLTNGKADEQAKNCPGKLNFGITETCKKKKKGENDLNMPYDDVVRLG